MLHKADTLPKWLCNNNGLMLSTPKRRWLRKDYLEKTLNNLLQIFAEDTTQHVEECVFKKVDVRIKLVLVIILIILVALMRDLKILLSFNLLLLLISVSSGITLTNYFKRVCLPTLLFSGVVLLPSILSLVTPGDSLLFVYQGSHSWPAVAITKQGLQGLAFVLFRAMASLNIVILLIKTSQWTEITQAMKKLGMPAIVVMVLNLTYRYIYLFLLVLSDYLLGRKSRLVGTENNKEQIAWIGLTIANFFRIVFEYSHDIAMAMLARGYMGEINRIIGGKCLTPYIFDLTNVTYNYGELRALSNISMQVSIGEKIVLLGANGCGKSTLQKILAGLIFPSTGQAIIAGQKITAQHMQDKKFSMQFRRKIGIVFQNSETQLFCASVLDEIMFGPIAMGMNNQQARQRVEEIMEYMGIMSLASRLPHHLSGGEKKKVAIAAVLATNPDVLIMDEPTNGLDPRTQRFIINMINELNKQGKTIITATHQLELVKELADRVIIISENHQLLADGQTKDILTNQTLLLEANLIDEHYYNVM